MSLATTASRRDPQHGLRLFTLRGVPVYLGQGWAVILLIMVLVFGPQIREELPSLGTAAYLGAVLYALILFVSVLLHELGHAFVARACGFPVTRIVANLWGGHTAYDPMMTTPGRSALVSAAGPMVNAAVAALGWLALSVMTPGIPKLLVWVLMWSNMLLAIFNVLPGLPLDGGFLVESAVWKVTGQRGKGTVAAGWSGRVVAVLVAFWFLARPLLSGHTPSLFSVVWTLFIVSMLWQGASHAITAGSHHAKVGAVPLSAVTHPVISVGEATPLADAISRAAAYGESVVLVVQNGPRDVPGLVDLRPAEQMNPQDLLTARTGGFVLAQPPNWIMDTVPGSEPTVADILARMGQIGGSYVALRGPSGQVYAVVAAADIQRALS